MSERIDPPSIRHSMSARQPLGANLPHIPEQPLGPKQSFSQELPHAGRRFDACERIGLLAGWGRFPVVVARTLQQSGHEVYCLGVAGHADAAALRPLCADYQTIGLGRVGGAIRYFARRGVRQATLAGKIHKAMLFQPWLVLRHLPDWRTWRCFYRQLVMRRDNCQDDTLLGIVVREFQADGIDLLPATDYAPQLLARGGVLSRREPTSAEWQDIDFGWLVAKQLGQLDVGQSVAIKNRTALAVEGIEGTDRCIERAGELCPSGGFTLVKTAKPAQDMRFDVPTVGLLSVQTLWKSGGRCLAFEQGRTILLDEPEVLAFADRHSMAVVSLAAAEMPRLCPEPTGPAAAGLSPAR